MWARLSHLEAVFDETLSQEIKERVKRHGRLERGQGNQGQGGAVQVVFSFAFFFLFEEGRKERRER